MASEWGQFPQVQDLYPLHPPKVEDAAYDKILSKRLYLQDCIRFVQICTPTYENVPTRLGSHSVTCHPTEVTFPPLGTLRYSATWLLPVFGSCGMFRAGRHLRGSGCLSSTLVRPPASHASDVRPPVGPQNLQRDHREWPRFGLSSTVAGDVQNVQPRRLVVSLDPSTRKVIQHSAVGTS